METSSLPTENIHDLLSSVNDYNSQWANLKPRQRLQRLKKLRKQISLQARSLAEQIGDYTLRPTFDVMTQEILATLEMARYCNKKMPRWLASKNKRYLRPGFFSARETLYFEPCGTVAVIMPSNFPFSLGMMSAFFLAAAGNTVILKPSEKLPEIVNLLKNLIRDSGLDKRTIQVVEGGPDTVHTLIDSSCIHKVFFFGRKASGDKVRQQCFNRHIPCVLETGSGSAAILDSDISLSRTAAGIAWSGLYVRGRSCIGTRLVFVKREIKKAFLNQLHNECSRMYGEYDQVLTLNSETMEMVKSSIERGAEFSPFFIKNDSNTTNGETKQHVPGILDVQPDDPILQKEIFDPVIILCALDQMGDAVKLINSSKNLIGTSIWTENRENARKLIQTLDTAMNWINDTSFGLPSLPWGGRDLPVQGMMFSRYALHEAGNWKWVIESRGIMRRFWWHPYSKYKQKMANLITRFY